MRQTRRPFLLRRSLASCYLLICAVGTDTLLGLAFVAVPLVALWVVDPTAWRDPM